MAEGTIAGKYRLEEVVGSGAFGTVFRATHVDIGRQFAIKVLEIPGGHEEQADAFRKRFMREARILGQLDHRNAVPVYDFGEEDGKLYFVMEFVQGRSLRQVLSSDAPLSEHRVIRITRQILGALAEAHELGLVHRDLKPSNVMIVGEGESETVKVVDFGIASAFRSDALPDAVELAVTGKGAFVGTPRYAAPEQLVGDTVAASDVYAVGLLMWDMLVGSPAVESKELEDCMRAHMAMEPWRLPTDVTVTRELRNVVETALRRRAEDRYDDAAAMLEALTRLSQARAVEQPPTLQVETQNSVEEQTDDLLVGKYELGPVIGAGGFSRVYRARHVDMQRTVAVKLLDIQGAVARTGSISAKDLRERFGREARVVSQLRHPNTITVYDFGVDDDGRWYIVMEYVEGTNLWSTVRKEGPFEPRRAARIARDMLRSLSEAHHRGILHRDLKPGNIMLTRDFEGNEVAKVLDFGIATVHDVGDLPDRFEVASATQIGTFVGTPQYAAPEQFVGERLTPATDLYAVGLVLWEMLEGRGAVEEESFGDCLQRHMSPQAWPIPERVPRGLSDILRGALEKNPEGRYLTAAEMADDLEKWLAGERQSFTPAPTTQQRWEPALDYEISQQPIIDPNVDQDFVPDFLRDDEQDDERAPALDTEIQNGSPRTKRRAPADRSSEEPRRPRAPTPEKLELDYEQVPPKQRDDRVVRPSRVHDDRRKRRFRFNRNWVIGAAALVVGGAIVYSATRPEPESGVDLLEEETMYLEFDEDRKPVKQKQRSHRYSTEGIIEAIKAGGWRVARAQDSTVLTNVHQQTYRLYRGESEIEIELVTTKSNAIAQKLFDDTRPPIQAVVFDNKLVRVFPPPQKGAREVGELINLLRRYRELVRESGEDE